MSLPLIVQGDTTSHGGTVIEGAPFFDTDGTPVALVGHLVTCPKCKGGPFPIISGASDMVCDGRPVARHGDKIACGATLISGQARSQWSAERGADNATSSGASAQSFTDQSLVDRLEGAFDEHFVLVDNASGKPIDGFAYGIATTGDEQEGKTGADGKTACACSNKPEAVNLKYAVQQQIGIRI
jgi:uncharacterized Zn-binding protein involved in type VI secretion